MMSKLSEFDVDRHLPPCRFERSHGLHPAALALASNKLTGSVPTEIGTLNLTGTIFDVHVKRHLLSYSLTGKHTQGIFLDDNKLTGTIPTEFSDMPLGKCSQFR